MRRAYKSVSLVCHPDKAGTKSESAKSAASTWFKKVKDAYDVIGDPVKRRAYDAQMGFLPEPSPATQPSSGPEGAKQTAGCTVAMTPFKKGDRVRIRGLTSATQYNVREAEVHSDQLPGEKVNVALLFGGEIKFINVVTSNLDKLDE